ncbi:MAG TPA: Xaa-Pro dipeptidyl-peptidase [Jatrophihabitantaceae bacterium]|nr:Xaa-Pro dipeptidyl-peptidase [Jatrophihabitantaceae bacterium]
MSWYPRVLSLTACAALVAAGLAVAAPARAATSPPYVQGSQTVPTYSYADAIRESVWVQSPLDSDHDGQPDRIAVDLVRPREAVAQHVRVPVIMDASPYYACCGRGNEGEIKEYDANGVISKEPLYYDNYFVPRGYAFVAVDLSGTNRSTGCEDVGGPAEVASAKAVIDWLNGRGRAYNADGSRAVATSWTNGKVGMIGKSWDGTIANGVAATGVAGLKTIVPISAISSWYDYMRFGGVLRSPGYVDYLANLVNGRTGDTCQPEIAAAQAASDDSTGNFNQFWAQRDFRLDARNVHASVFVVHGINDQNVTTNQFGTWWNELADRGVPRKIWLHQGSHVDPFDMRRSDWVDELHQWFDYWLQGLHNGVMGEPQASVERADGTWVDQPTWPALGAHPVSVPLGNGDGTTGTLGGGHTGTRAFTDDPALSEAQAVASPNTAVNGRLAFLSAPLTHDVRISGAPSVTLRVQVDKPTTELSARLVDYGTQRRVNYLGREEGITTLSTESCWGESTPADDACYFDTVQDFVTSDTFITARGWLDAAHYRSLTRVTPLQPGRWYTITVPLDDYDALVPSGHVLGLVLTQSDNEYTTPTPTGATVKVDLSGSRLTLPIAGSGLPHATSAPTVRTTTPAITPKVRIDNRRPRFQ